MAQEAPRTTLWPTSHREYSSPDMDEKSKRHLKIQRHHHFDLESSGDDLFSPSFPIQPRSPRRMRRYLLRGTLQPRSRLSRTVLARDYPISFYSPSDPTVVRYQPKASARPCNLSYHHLRTLSPQRFLDHTSVACEHSLLLPFTGNKLRVRSPAQST